MGDYFHGWPRKLGVVTLVTACVLTMGLVRSWNAFDELRFMTGKYGQFFYSEFGRFHWRCSWPAEEDRICTYFSSGFHSRELGINDPAGVYGKYFVFRCSRGSNILIRSAYLSVEFAYLVAVVPLTLLSVYLLHVKPRPKNTPAKST